MLVSDHAVLGVVRELRRESEGAGPLEELLRLDGVTDVLVNGPDQVFVDTGAGLVPSGIRFADDDEVRRVAVRMAASVGRRLDDASPYVDARLPSGVRVHAVLSPLSRPGTCLSLRVPSRRRLTLSDWVANGSLHPHLATVLRRVVDKRIAHLISGGTGTGKTTLLGAMLAQVPPGERLLIVEDSRELDPDHPHVVSLEARQPNSEGVGEITLATLVRQSLRMRPDRVIVGEVRGAEVVDLLAALNTGHEGGCGTVHANSATDVPARLEALASLAGLGRQALHAQLGSALDLVIHVRRRASGRRWVASLHTLCRGDDGFVVAQPAVEVGEAGSLVTGPGASRLEELLA